MANMEDRIDNFIAENNFDENIKDDLIDLINCCFTDYVTHMAKEWLSTPTAKKSTSVTAKTKKIKLDDPTQADCPEMLMNCTILTLNEYCKKTNIKTGGNKTELVERVWAHMQGNEVDDDVKSKQSSSNPKNETEQSSEVKTKNIKKKAKKEKIELESE
jgi:hypothetical protein